ncbi:MAG: FtsX-like permease family protein [Anaerovoracaceae bacterium]
MKMSRRGIKKSLSRFLSIVSIVALGTGFLAGLMATAPDMLMSANDYYRENKTYDFMVRGTLGVTDSDQEALQNEKYIDKTELIYQKDMIFEDENKESLTTRLMEKNFQNGRLKTDLNDLVLVDGRMPKTKDECVVEVPNMYSYKGKHGMKYKDKESDKTYKTVGIVKSSFYISEFGDVTNVGSGRITLGMYVMPQKERKTFTTIYATAQKDSAIDTYSDEYIDNVIKKNEDDLKALGNVQSKERAEEVKNTQLKKIQKEENKLKNEKDKAYNELAKAKAELNSNKAEVNKGFNEIAKGRKDLDLAKAKLINQENKLDKVAPQIEEAKKALEAGYPVTDQVKKQIAEYDKGREQIAAGKVEIENKYNYLENQEKSLITATKVINNGYETYNINKEKADKEFAKAAKEIENAKEKVKDIDNSKWIINDRLDNIGISNFEKDVDKIAAIAKLFPIFFFLVAALVALTTMTRMIEEERSQIGCLKSLGYDNKVIRNYYLGYGLLATIIGSVVGQAIGFYIFPKVISGAYAMMYNLPPTTIKFIPIISVWVTAAIIACILLTSYLACRQELKEKPASLLLPKAPPAGKRIFLERITPIWSRLKFTRKVTLRNLFRYKKRFLMTIIGIAGCFALLVTGFGVKGSIGNIVGLQYGELYNYDYTILLDKEDFKPSSKYITDYQYLRDEAGKVKSSKSNEDVTLKIVKDPEEFGKFVTLRDRKSHQEYKLTNEGVIITEKTCEILGISIGDSVTVVDNSGNQAKVKVTGISENYVDSFCYFSEDYFNEAYNRNIKYNSMIAMGNYDEGYTSDEITEYLLKQEGAIFVNSSKDIEETFSDSVKNIDYIIYVLIVAAGALAVIVLYNLTNVNICERKKELATIKVLGFYQREVASYIFREINILSYIGIVFGVPLGIMLHQFVIRTAEVGGIMFGRSISLISFVLAAILTVLFTLFVNLIMGKKIKDIDMASSMKAND